MSGAALTAALADRLGPVQDALAGLVQNELWPNAPWEPALPARTAEQIEALVDLFFERMAPGFSVETSP